MFAEGLKAVLGACRSETAASRLERGYAHLVEPDEHDEGPACDFLYRLPDLTECRFHWMLPFLLRFYWPFQLLELQQNRCLRTIESLLWNMSEEIIRS